MNNLLAKQDLSSKQLAMVQQEMNHKEKSKGVMYVLWWFTGVVGGHRFYLGDVGYAIGMLLTLGGLGFWALIDVFLIGGRREEVNRKIEASIIEEVKLYGKSQENAIQQA